jgi:transcriptional regulator with PAS, ATPase and Fis domain
VNEFSLTVLAGLSKPESRACHTGRLSVGSHLSNDFVLDDPTVSRFHAEVVVEDGILRVRDLASRNGVYVDGVRAFDVGLRHGSQIHLGNVVLTVESAGARRPRAISSSRSFGRLVGASVAMRGVYRVLEQTAATDATILIEGETGTGKDLAAESIHAASARRHGPFVVVDCASVSANLIASELFGHEKGAFTGAVGRRAGAFESAHGGTVFLDEVGELPLELQAHLLRVLESRAITPLGGNQPVPVDVRVVAATHRDLRRMVNEGRFRSDLYYRIGVIRVTLPPLRQRLEDLSALVPTILASLGAGTGAEALLSTEYIGLLSRSSWPGNVRELRNHLERELVLGVKAPFDPGEELVDDDQPEPDFSDNPSYAVARQESILRFERKFLRWFLRAHGTNIAEGARVTGMSRRYIYDLRKTHGM